MEIQLPVQHANCDNLGIGMKPIEGGGEQAEKEIAKTKNQLDKYLKHFTPGNCPKCGSEIGGIFGSFRWGMATGEGGCSVCDWPVRAHHTIPKVGKLNSFALAYHPDYVTADEAPTPK